MTQPSTLVAAGVESCRDCRRFLSAGFFPGFRPCGIRKYNLVQSSTGEGNREEKHPTQQSCILTVHAKLLLRSGRTAPIESKLECSHKKNTQKRFEMERTHIMNLSSPTPKQGQQFNASGGPNSCDHNKKDMSFQQGSPPSRSWSSDSDQQNSSTASPLSAASTNSSSRKGRRGRKDWHPSSHLSTSPSSVILPVMYITHPHPPALSLHHHQPCQLSYRPPVPKKLPGWSPENCVSLDAEMVGVGRYGEESSVARVVLVDYNGKVLFDQYIKQTQPVVDYRTFVSGITPLHLATAEWSLRMARKRILKILYGRLLIGHALKNDLQSLGISHPWYLIRDTARFEPFMQTVGLDKTSLWPRKLKDLCWEKLGKNIQEYGKPHCPYEDAVAALDLYKTVREDWERLYEKKVAKTNGIQLEEQNYYYRNLWVSQQIHRQQQQQQQQEMAYLNQMQQAHHKMMQQQECIVTSHYDPKRQGVLPSTLGGY